MKRNLDFVVFTLGRFLCNFPHAEWRNWIGILCVSVCASSVLSHDHCICCLKEESRPKVFSWSMCSTRSGSKAYSSYERERKNVLRVNMVKVRLQLKVGLLMLCETNKSFSFPRPTFTIVLNSSCSSRHQYFLKSSRRSQLAFHVPTTSKIL